MHVQPSALCVPDDSGCRLEDQAGLTAQTWSLPPTTLGGRAEDPDSTGREPEAQGATGLVSGEVQAFENCKQQLSDRFLI